MCPLDIRTEGHSRYQPFTTGYQTSVIYYQSKVINTVFLVVVSQTGAVYKAFDEAVDRCRSITAHIQMAKQRQEEMEEVHLHVMTTDPIFK